jgi:hypothetical protein
MAKPKKLHCEESIDVDHDHVICPTCGAKVGSDTETHCKHVLFVITEGMVNRYNTTKEMDEWLDDNVGNDSCTKIKKTYLTMVCRKFKIKLLTLTEVGICCGPISYEYTFGFGRK